jgi:hypothetical protein
MEDEAQVMAFGRMWEQWLFYLSDSYVMLCLESKICIFVLVVLMRIWDNIMTLMCVGVV